MMYAIREGLMHGFGIGFGLVCGVTVFGVCISILVGGLGVFDADA